jgi:glutamyl-tRNA synthetase
MAWAGNEEDAALKGFKEEGYLSEAFVNFISLLGWNSGTEEEIFSMEDLINDFSLERINKAGAKFDINKATWFNQQHIRKLSLPALANNLTELTSQNNIDCSEEKALAIVELLQERIDLIPELLSKGQYFFSAPTTYVDKVVRKKWKEAAKKVFIAFSEILNKKDELTADGFKSSFESSLAQCDTQVGMVMQILRVAVTGEAGGPDLMQIMEILGTKEVNDRIRSAIKAFDEAVSHD